MKAAYLNEKGGAERLIVGELSKPSAGPGEALVKVHATAIMPTELQWFPTFYQRSGEPRPFPIVLSHEFSGVVESVGAGVKNLAAGDEVYGLNDWFGSGAQAEYCVVAATAAALKPKTLDHLHSAVVPISALTAWQGLFEKGELRRGQRVLIHGAAGGVGSFAVQLAHGSGVQVVATASSANVEFVRSLGADEVIDYQKARFEDVARDMDTVLDGIGGETLERSWGIVRPGGKVVTVATSAPESKDERVRNAFMLVRADGAQLAEIAKWIDAGRLRVLQGEVFPLARTREAYARAERGKMRGKIAVQVPGETCERGM